MDVLARIMTIRVMVALMIRKSCFDVHHSSCDCIMITDYTYVQKHPVLTYIAREWIVIAQHE